MAKVFIIDAAKCNGCYNCQLACKDENASHDWAPYSAPQPETGHFWLKLHEHLEGSTPKLRMHYTAELCNHCRNAACIDVCPTGAAYRRGDGLVILDPEKCGGCKKCMEACPYNAIYFNDALSVAQKCTGCAHLLDSGYEKPRCVEACPHEAIRFGEEAELADEIPGADVRKPETGALPRVYYRNLPGKFIAGTVYDPAAKEIIEGAKVRAVSGGKILHTETDGFGDFWFNDLRVGKWDVTIEAKGFKLRAFEGLRTDASVNLGDVALERA